MKSSSFVADQISRQVRWRATQDISEELGRQNGREYAHIIPKREWEKTIIPDIREALIRYLHEKKIQHHTGTHNLMSSWVLCANLYFICRTDTYFRNLMATFLSENIGYPVDGIEDVELEFASDDDLSPKNLLGEEGGIRGSGQTSPDVAFVIQSEGRLGIVLTECKYTEHSFYSCSGRKKRHGSGKSVNPDPTRCLSKETLGHLKQECHQYEWDRRYWDLAKLGEVGLERLRFCPASRAGYQLLRQQALAEGIAQSGRFSPVVSAVAFDGRNSGLMRSMHSTGIEDISGEWGALFVGRARFTTWCHQDWVEFVRRVGDSTKVGQWLEFNQQRYGM